MTVMFTVATKTVGNSTVKTVGRLSTWQMKRRQMGIRPERIAVAQITSLTMRTASQNSTGTTTRAKAAISAMTLANLRFLADPAHHWTK